VSALVADEPYCDFTAGLCLDSARRALKAVTTLSHDRSAAFRSLSDAVLLSGLGMQALVSSRPASSAEHTISHFWELNHSVGRPDLELHGLLVGLSCSMLQPIYGSLYREFASLCIDVEARVRQLEDEPPWHQTLVPEIEPFRAHMQEEMAGIRADPEIHRIHLQRIREQRGPICDLAVSLMGELEQAISLLRDLSYPFDPAEYALSPAQARLPLGFVRFLRNRYSSFSLFHEVGLATRFPPGRRRPRCRSGQPGRRYPPGSTAFP
jgi:glycerol-1-phosphate dehydrogenase [NAD(P)+]